MNFSGQISGIAAPIITGYVVQGQHSFAWAFVIPAIYRRGHCRLSLPARGTLNCRQAALACRKRGSYEPTLLTGCGRPA